MVFRNKAQCAGNGSSLSKHCNAVAGHHSNALRVGLSAPMDGVAPLGKGTTLPGETRLAMNTDKPTASVTIRLIDHLGRISVLRNSGYSAVSAQV